MSINCKEIDCILSELDIVGAQIQKIIQPSFDTLILSCYKPACQTELLICVAHGACRLHSTELQIPKSKKPQRFVELLKAHIKDSRINSISQIGCERIIKFDIGQLESKYLMYVRLWSGAANIILCKPDGYIVDVLTRKPKKGEIAGGQYNPEEAFVNQKPNNNWSMRVIPGDESFNEKIDKLYASSESELSIQSIKEKVVNFFEQKILKLNERLIVLGNVKKNDANRLKQFGDLLMANQHLSITPSSTISVDDFFTGATVSIQVNSKLSIVENAQAYYEKSKKVLRTIKEADEEILTIQASIQKLTDEYNKVLQCDNPYILREYLSKQDTKKIDKKFPCLAVQKNEWIILVGRSAVENDELLRFHVKGNDMWLHARDYSGSYVFIKARAGKTVPLDILLDAGMLALYYSKGRTSGAGDIYYTQAKYLKRVKNGPKGLVIPSQEKNLRVLIDTKVIDSLQAQVLIN